MPDIPIPEIEPVSAEPELVSVEPEPVSVEPESASVKPEPTVSDPVVDPESMVESEPVIEAVPLVEPEQVKTETELGINKNPKDEIIYIRTN